MDIFAAGYERSSVAQQLRFLRRRQLQDSVTLGVVCRSECESQERLVYKLAASLCGIFSTRVLLGLIFLRDFAQKAATAHEHSVFCGTAPFEQYAITILARVAGHFDRDFTF